MEREITGDGLIAFVSPWTPAGNVTWQYSRCPVLRDMVDDDVRLTPGDGKVGTGTGALSIEDYLRDRGVAAAWSGGRTIEENQHNGSC